MEPPLDLRAPLGPRAARHAPARRAVTMPRFPSESKERTLLGDTAMGPRPAAKWPRRAASAAAAPLVRVRFTESASTNQVLALTRTSSASDIRERDSDDAAPDPGPRSPWHDHDVLRLGPARHGLAGPELEPARCQRGWRVCARHGTVCADSHPAGPPPRPGPSPRPIGDTRHHLTHWMPASYNTVPWRAWAGPGRQKWP
jgi:hypothetical protein